MLKSEFFFFIIAGMNLLVSAAFLMPVSSSGESWLRPMRSNLQHAKTEEQHSEASMEPFAADEQREAVWS